MEHVNEYEVLVKRAKDFLLSSEYALDRGIFDLACFFAEQCVQLYIKAKLLKLIGDYPRTHHVRQLLSRLLEVVSEDCREKLLGFIRANRAGLSELEDAYVMSRYSTKTYTEEDARDMIGLAREVLKVIDEIVR